MPTVRNPIFGKCADHETPEGIAAHPQRKAGRTVSCILHLRAGRSGGCRSCAIDGMARKAH